MKHCTRVVQVVTLVILAGANFSALLWPSSSSRILGADDSDCSVVAMLSSSQQQQQQHQQEVPAAAPKQVWSNDTISSVGFPTDADKNDESVACRVFEQRFHAMNECFRSWLQPCPQQNYEFGSGSGNNRITRAEPLLLYAFFAGQGVGRLIDHAAGTALLAYTLGRPFVMDLAWDPHGVLRFLLDAGSYPWQYQDDGSSRHRAWLQKHEPNVTKAIEAMDEKGHSSWVNLPPDLTDVLPLQKLDSNVTRIDEADMFEPSNKARYAEIAMNLWSRTRDHQILLSPNWGDGWIKHIEMEHLDGCPKDRAHTIVQNALWAPTTALHSQFAKRRDQVLGKATAQEEPHGAIHFRTHFMRGELPGKDETEELREGRLVEAMTDVLEDCAIRLSDQGITKWWVLSDNDKLASSMLEKMRQRQQTPKNITANNASDKTLDQFTFLYKTMDGGKHTRLAAQKGLNVDAMLPGMLDWMTLGSSDIAVVSPSTAFGKTGASAVKGKLWRRVCGIEDVFTLKVFENPDKTADIPLSTRDKNYIESFKQKDVQRKAGIIEERRRQRRKKQAEAAAASENVPQ